MAKKKKKSAKKSTGKSQADEHGHDEDVMGLLAGLGKDYHADPVEDGFDELPDGRYQTQIEDIVLNQSKTSKRLQLSFETTVVSGDYVNRKIFLHLGLDSKENVGKTKGQLMKLGFAFPEDSQELPDATQALVGTYAEVQLKTSKQSGGQWRTFTGLIDSDEVEAPAAGEAVEEGMEIGTRVYSDEYGEEELGMVTAADDETITIEFDDGTISEYPINEVHEVETEEAEEETEAEPAEDVEVTVTFEEDSLTEKQIDAIGALATEQGFDSDKYDTWSELLADIAEELGVSGKFGKCKKLIAAVSEASEE